MSSKIIRFHSPMLGSSKQVIYDPFNGYATVSHRRVGGKIHRQLYPYERYNNADVLVNGKKESVSKKNHSDKIPKKQVANKSKVSKAISKILSGGTISSIV